MKTNSPEATIVSEKANWNSINLLTISDIHLGCPSNPAKFMVKGLEKLLSSEALRDIDILVIAGDVFDKGLAFDHDDVQVIVTFLGRLIARCRRLDVTVRIVKGTPSHDREQSRVFEALNNGLPEDQRCDLKYFEEVEIEYMESYGLHILYVPDEKNTSDAVTLMQVREMMRSRAIEKVDFAVMHGFFEFQVPMGNHRHHDSKEYLELVRYLIFIGHDHTAQQYDRIIVQGSPDRQRHGMEEDKGCVRSVVNRDGTYKVKFVVNKDAMIFKTLTLPDDLEEADRLVCDTCDKLPNESHLRLAGYRGNPALVSLDVYSRRYPFLKFSPVKFLDEEKEQESNIIEPDEDDEYKPFTIDKSNISEIITSRVTGLETPEEFRYLKELIESVS